MRFILLCLLFVGGCSNSAVRCDAHLRPINSPAPKAVVAADAERTPQ
jgi:hypothetical protein